MRKWYRIAFAMIVLLLAASIVSFAAPSHVHAASNGLQVEFTVNHSSCYGANIGTVTITGQNQNGDTVTWSGQSSDAPYGQSLITSNWWWVGAIHITYNNGANFTDAYVPQQATSDYPYSDQGYVLVTCAGTQMNYSTVTTSDGYYWACISRDNPTGHITYYKYWYGYVYTAGANGYISGGGYALGPNGKIVPYDVTDTVTVPECDLW